MNRIRQQLEQAQVDYSRACQNQRAAQADWDEIRTGQRACGERAEDNCWRELQDSE